MNWIGFERFWIEPEFELEDSELELNEKELSIWYLCDAVKDILQIVGSITVQAMVFMTKESWTMKLLVKHYKVTNQWMKLMNGKSIRLVLLPCVNECWQGTASKNHWNFPDNNHTFPVSQQADQ